MYRVMIVEDEELLRKGLIFTFDWASLNCLIVGEARNGSEGLEMIRLLNPDLVITDIKMPVMDGLTMLSQFKQASFESIIMTGFEEFDYAKKAIELNVAKYITKPIDEKELRAAIQDIIQKINQKKHYQALESNKQISFIENVSNQNVQFDKYTRQIIDYIDAHYQSRISLDDIAAELKISVGYVAKVFKESTGYSVNDYLNRYRITKSIELLKLDQYRLFEIAEMCGFSEYKYFHRVFRLYVKMSPKDFISSNYYR